MTRTIEGADAEYTIDAASRVFMLAGDKFSRFAQTESGFTAYINGDGRVAVWTFEATRHGAAVLARISGSMSENAMLPLPVIGGGSKGGFVAGFGPSATNPVEGNAAYALFWDRLAYMLHKRNDWTTCDQAEERTKADPAAGSLAALCWYGFPNARPREDMGPKYIAPARPGMDWPAVERLAVDRAPPFKPQAN